MRDGERLADGEGFRDGKRLADGEGFRDGERLTDCVRIETAFRY